MSAATESSLPAVAAQEVAANQAITLGQQSPAAASSKLIADQPADSTASPLRRAVPEAPGTMLLLVDITYDATAFRLLQWQSSKSTVIGCRPSAAQPTLCALSAWQVQGLRRLCCSKSIETWVFQVQNWRCSNSLW